MSSVEIRLEKCSPLVVKFAADEPVLPPCGPAIERVEVVTRNKFSPGGDGVFDKQIAPLIAGDGDAHGHNISDVQGAAERIEMVGDLVVPLLRRHTEIVPRDA